VIVVAGLPVHHYRADDAVAQAYAMVLLVESGFRAADGSRADVRDSGGATVRRYQERYAQGRNGGGWGREGGLGVAGRPASVGPSGCGAWRTLKSQGLSKPERSRKRLGRPPRRPFASCWGPSKGEELEQLALVSPSSTRPSVPPSTPISRCGHDRGTCRFRRRTQRGITQRIRR